MTQKRKQPELKKRPYRVPKLTVHGDLKKLTMVKGGSAGDGGKPASRLVGPPG